MDVVARVKDVQRVANAQILAAYDNGYLAGWKDRGEAFDAKSVLVGFAIGTFVVGLMALVVREMWL
jgi:hypothetical protein